MRIEDNDVDRFWEIGRKHHIELSPAESRETLSRLLVMFERFSSWFAKEKAGGRIFDDQRPQDDRALDRS